MAKAPELNFRLYLGRIPANLYRGKRFYEINIPENLHTTYTHAPLSTEEGEAIKEKEAFYKSFSTIKDILEDENRWKEILIDDKMSLVPDEETARLVIEYAENNIPGAKGSSIPYESLCMYLDVLRLISFPEHGIGDVDYLVGELEKSKGLGISESDISPEDGFILIEK